MPIINARDVTHTSQFPYNKGECGIPHMVHKSSTNTSNSHDITLDPIHPKRYKNYKIMQNRPHGSNPNPARR